MRRSIICSVLAATLLGQSACSAVTPGFSLLPPPPSEDIRSEFGIVGVSSGKFLPKFELSGPAKGPAQGAGRGAGIGAAYGALPAAGGGLGAVVGVAGAIVGAVVGLPVGAFLAESPAKLVEKEAALRKAVADLRIQETFRDRVIVAGRDETRHAFVPVAAYGPNAPGEQVDYRALANEGVQTILEVSVETIDLHGVWWHHGAMNPPLLLRMTVRTQLVRTGDRKELYGHTLTYQGPARPLEDWLVSGGKRLREELDRASASLVERIVDEVFLLY
ncbi:MAG: hypothetical protein L0191_07140 [Acidobacteria bacterium]|nr:hypothetical protein [Acidobacteriota bacterium]